MKLGNLVSLVLLLALVFDVSYGILTYNAPYGCNGTVNQSTQPTNKSIQPSGGANWKVLTDPCFYIYYFGMLGGSALVISLIPATKKKVASWSDKR